MNTQQLHILRHSLGIGDDGCGTAYRNHFVTGEGSSNHPDCMSLVASGHMERGSPSPLTGGDDLFIVTKLGRAAAAPPPRSPQKAKTRSARRYDRYLDADGGLTFGEWLRQGNT